MYTECPMTRRITYDNNATFIPVCEKCCRFVKADDTVRFNYFDELKDEPNATCTRCGRVQMIFEGWIEEL